MEPLINYLPLAWMPSGYELLFIVFIVLLLFGPKHLPELARALGQAKKEFTKATREASDEIEKIKQIPPSDPSQNNALSKKI